MHSNMFQYACKHLLLFLSELIQLKLCVFSDFMNHELPDVQAGLGKDRGTRDQIANMHWIIEKAREFQKNIFLLY